MSRSRPVERRGPQRDADHSLLLVATTIAIGVANYAMSWVVVRVLSAGEFTAYAAAQGLLLVLGTGSLVAVPWAVARFVAREPEATRSAGMRYGLVASAIQAVLLAGVAFGVGWRIGGGWLAVVVGAGAACISLLAAPTGWLQGRSDIRGFAAVRVIETTLRIALGLALVFTFTRSATVALAGFSLGAAVACGYGLYRSRAAFPMAHMPPGVARSLLSQSVVIGGLQVLLAALAAMDTVYIAMTPLAGGAVASYQSAALVARIPLFFSSAISVAVFAAVAVARDDAEVGASIRPALASFTWLAVPFVAACLSVPAPVLHLAVPAAFTQVPEILRITGVAGVLIAAVNVVTTLQQARMSYARCLALLVVVVVAQGGVLVWAGHSGHVLLFSTANLAIAAVALVVTAHDARRWLQPRRPRWTWWYVPTAAGVVLALAGHTTWMWALGMALATVAAVTRGLVHRPRPAGVSAGPRRTPEVS